VDDINNPTPYTQMYVKVRTSRTIEVVEATVMPSLILHGQPVSAECAVLKVTTIREGCELKELDYHDEEEGIEKLVDAKGIFILCPIKILLSNLVRHRLFRYGAQRLGALLLQTCRSLLKTLMHQ
jgi:hypothetical protein